MELRFCATCARMWDNATEEKRREVAALVWKREVMSRTRSEPYAFGKCVVCFDPQETTRPRI